jgi:hypothetical protein
MMEPLDDKATCLALAEKIEQDVLIARNHRWVNTVISVIAVIMLANNWWLGIKISRQVNDDYLLSKGSSSTLSTVQAKQDLYRQQYLNYIKDTIDFMQRLQDENKSLKIPPAPVPRSLVPSLDDVTEQDLQRVIQTKPGPTPTPITKVIIKKGKKSRPKPTPGVIERLFKPKSTR